MARPRYSENEPTAKQRLHDAFWECLAQHPYGEITISMLCSMAHVSRNTPYYYYENLQDLTADAVASTLDPELLRSIIIDEDVKRESITKERRNKVSRICLLAGGNASPELRAMLKNALSKTWSEMLNIRPAELSAEKRLRFEFLLGGIMEVFAYWDSTSAALTFDQALFSSLRKDYAEQFAKL